MSRARSNLACSSALKPLAPPFCAKAALGETAVQANRTPASAPIVLTDFIFLLLLTYGKKLNGELVNFGGFAAALKLGGKLTAQLVDSLGRVGHLFRVESQCERG